MSEPTADPLEATPGAPAPAAAPPPDRSLSGRLRAFRARHARAEMLAFFAGGFLFDAGMLKRIDDGAMLIQQGAYLAVVGLVLGADFYFHATHREPPRLLRRVWPFAEHVLHFMMGTLLNAYALFYFKSGTGLTALLFAVVIAGLLLVNEHPYFHKLGPVVLVSLYSFCLTSYFAYLFPVLVGSLRAWMFVLAVGLATAPIGLLAWLLGRWSGDRARARRQIAIPGGAVQGALLLLYVLRLIPPVPLSVERMGIYHQVERDPAGGGYLLSHQPIPEWAFWRKGDQDYSARTGDRIYCFVRIFAPRNFRDRVFIRYAFDDPQRGWIPFEPIPLTIVGGREDGYGGYAYKAHYQPGTWRVVVELADGRDIGSLRFTVTEDASTGPRELVQDRG